MNQQIRIIIGVFQIHDHFSRDNDLSAMDGIEQILFQTNPFETTQEYLSETAIAFRISPTTSSS